NAGNVGIGTLTPTFKLDVLAPNNGLQILSGNSANYVVAEFGRTADEGDLGIANGNNAFFTGASAGDFSVRALAGKLGLTTLNSSTANTAAIKLSSGDETGTSLTSGAITI